MTNTNTKETPSTDQQLPRDAYLHDGRTVRVMARIDGKYLVELGYEDGDGELFYQGFETVDRIFDAAPTEAFEKRIRTLEIQEKEVRDRLFTLRTEHSTAEREMKKRLDYLKQFESLELVEDFLQGRITHFVICDYSKVLVQAREQALDTKDDYDRWSKELKLLTLFGKANGCLQWRLNRYSDGSGHSTDVFPCTSLEAAQAKAVEIIASRFEELRGKGGGYPHGINYVMDSAKALGVPIPPDIQECWDLHKAKFREERIKKLETELASARAES